MNLRATIFIILCTTTNLKSAVLRKDVLKITSQGLYAENDKVTILAKENFDQIIYGQKNAWLVQFYNSFCGHCRAFYPNFKLFAADVEAWHKLVRLAVMDCSVEENVNICRQFEVMTYPSLRYMHENYPKANSLIGEHFNMSKNPETLTENLLVKIKDERNKGRLQHAPTSEIETHASLSEALRSVPAAVNYTFVVFETPESTVGSKLILDTMDYERIAVKRIFSTSLLAQREGVNTFPGLLAVDNKMHVASLTPDNPSRTTLLQEIDTFLESKNMPLPTRQSSLDYTLGTKESVRTELDEDIVNIADLEATLRLSLHTEITRHKELRDETLKALFNYLTVLIDYFPFRGNGKEYLIDLRGTLRSRTSWTGEEIEHLLQRLEHLHAPTYSSRLAFVGCRGSEPRYRGYTCGLWTLFHTLTVSAATARRGDASLVLRAMHDYVQHFFGCTDCSQHFRDMAQRNKIFEVEENDKAVLWLWISHNEVNLRLAGDSTEDPAHPKMQFPSAERCPECRRSGSWELPEVYRYLVTMYSPGSVRDAHGSYPVLLSSLDVSASAVVYVLSLGVLLLASKLFYARTKRFLVKKAYKRHLRHLYTN